ncbi:MAG: serine O-acetyltransferase EpsC [Pseudomonadota bacterium]
MADENNNGQPYTDIRERMRLRTVAATLEGLLQTCLADSNPVCTKEALPSLERVDELIELFQGIFFPGYRSEPIHGMAGLTSFMREKLERAFDLTYEQLKLCVPFRWKGQWAKERGVVPSTEDIEETALALTRDFFARLPAVRARVKADVYAAYDGDPAALTYEEVILSYPAVFAISTYRVAHEFYDLDIPLLPRILTESVHSKTGIDIHPGATVGDRFFIDHGTGVVIGETTVIGDRVRLYQGVTLGGRSFVLDELGRPRKGVKRHPTVEDDVVIYAGATILGGETTIGKGSVIGGNVWLTRSVPPFTRVLQKGIIQEDFSDGAGI